MSTPEVRRLKMKRGALRTRRQVRDTQELTWMDEPGMIEAEKGQLGTYCPNPGAGDGKEVWYVIHINSGLNIVKIDDIREAQFVACAAIHVLRDLDWSFVDKMPPGIEAETRRLLKWFKSWDGMPDVLRFEVEFVD